MIAKLPALFFYLLIQVFKNVVHKIFNVIPVPSSVIPAKAGIQGKA